MSQQVEREPQDAYPLDPARLPKTLYQQDLARGVIDVTGSNKVALTWSSNGGYDGLWLHVKGESVARGEAYYHAKTDPLGPAETTAYLDKEMAQRLYNTLGALIAKQRRRGRGPFTETAHTTSPAYPASPRKARKEIDQAGLEAGLMDCYGRTNVALIPLSDADEDTIAVRLGGDALYDSDLDPTTVVVGQVYPGANMAHMDKAFAQTLHTTLGLLIARMRP